MPSFLRTTDEVEKKGTFIANPATGEVLRRYHVGVQEEPMPLIEKAATALMTVAIAGVGPACVALLLFL